MYKFKKQEIKYKIAKEVTHSEINKKDICVQKFQITTNCE